MRTRLILVTVLVLSLASLLAPADAVPNATCADSALIGELDSAVCYLSLDCASSLCIYSGSIAATGFGYMQCAVSATPAGVLYTSDGQQAGSLGSGGLGPVENCFIAYEVRVTQAKSPVSVRCTAYFLAVDERMRCSASLVSVA